MQENIHGISDAFIFIKSKNGLADFAAELTSSIKIVLLFEGETRVWIENKDSELASEGDAIVVFPNQKYRFETQKKGTHIMLSADIKHLSEILSINSSYTPARNVISGAARDTEIRTLAKNALRAYNEDKSDYRDTVIKGYVTALLGKLFSMLELNKNETKAAKGSDTLNEIIEYCNLHFKDRLSLATLERDLHISKYYISHIINERLGEGFNEYINSIRINEACKLLIESNKSVKEISAAVGFGTVRSFDRAFSAKKGETAREYRKRNTEISKKA